MSKQFKVICNVTAEEFGPYSAGSEVDAIAMAAADAKLKQGEEFWSATAFRVDAEGVAEINKLAADSCDFS